MTEAGPASPTRTRRVLDPSFVEDIQSIPVDELRRRRDEVLAEREYQSYLRRLVQVRLDILNAEKARRKGGEAPEALVDRLASVLSEGPQGRGRGEALRLAPPEEDTAEAAQRADRATGGAFGGPLETLDDAVLDRALQGLQDEERIVSEERAAVFRVHDVIQAELKRRYREDPSLIPLDF